MKPAPQAKAFLGYQKGDRVLVAHWRLVKGGMTGTVNRVFLKSLEVAMDSGETCRVRDEAEAEFVGLRRLKPDEEFQPW